MRLKLEHVWIKQVLSFSSIIEENERTCLIQACSSFSRRLTCLVSATYLDVLTTLPSAFDVPVSNWKVGSKGSARIHIIRILSQYRFIRTRCTVRNRINIILTF